MKTLAELRQHLSDSIGDWYKSLTVTTNLAADKNIICTDLAQYSNRDSFFDRWWVIVTSLNNIGTIKKVQDYKGLATQLICLGANFSADSSAATFEVHKYDPNNYTRAINEAARQLNGWLFRKIEWNDTLVMGDNLPNSHFEDWTSTSYPDYYRLTNATAAKTSTAGQTYGGKYAAKVTASTGNGYMYISSDQYPSLLNLEGETVSFRSRAYPEVANDASITIYTIKADGTEQTLTSTSVSYAGKYNLIELENQKINDDIVKIEFRFNVATNGKYVIYDAARAIGGVVYEYVLPLEFNTGDVQWVYQQITGTGDHICDDPSTSKSHTVPVWGWKVADKDGVKYLRLPYSIGSERKLILQGTGNLEDNLSSETDQMTINDPHTSLLVAFAAYLLYEKEAGSPAAMDRDYLRGEATYWLGKAEYLKRSCKMVRSQSQGSFGVV